jgi:hypothetical protein
MSRFALVTAALSAAVSPIVFAQVQGPSSSQTPYVLPTHSGVTTTSILTVGDTAGGYKMVGIPDGLGAWKSASQGNFNLVMNHELGGTAGIVRAHGQTGAFVSRWEIQPDLTVISGRDHNTSSADAYEYYSSTSSWSNAVDPSQRWNRFCSADLPAASAFKFDNLGTDARIFMNGEEAGNEGRAYAHIVTGPSVNQTWQLPHLGKFSWENSVASPFAQQKTVVIGLDDSTPGQVYAYVGNKTSAGNDIERAGLTNGELYGIRVSSLPTEVRPTAASGRFDMVNLGNVANTTGGTLQADSNAASVTNFLRPEDGQWDPRPGKQNDFYFVTTDRYNTSSTEGHSRLYRMRFDDVTNPAAGGEVTALLDGFFDGPQMMDNMTVDSHGRILIQEDIGGNPALGRIWLYDIDSGNRGIIAQHDPSRFSAPVAPFSQDEESSGIIDARDLLGDGWFLLDVQAHYGNGTELVEGGQLLAMYVNPSVVPEPAALTFVTLTGLLLRRRR